MPEELLRDGPGTVSRRQQLKCIANRNPSATKDQSPTTDTCVRNQVFAYLDSRHRSSLTPSSLAQTAARIKAGSLQCRLWYATERERRHEHAGINDGGGLSRVSGRSVSF
jgi:hypothetical protein